MEEAGNPNANDYREIIGMKKVELIKELKQVRSENGKQLLCRVKLNALLTKPL